ncbi:hypothetical protein V2J09_009301 [Rumex salicifolius]
MQSFNLPGKSRILIFRFFMALLLNSTGHNINHCSFLPINQIQPSLNTLNLDGNIDFKQVDHAARDFGNRFHFLPAAVLYPKSVSDISSLINHVLQMGPSSELTIAARGCGHSLQGQSQAYKGIIVSMGSLKSPKIHVHTGEVPYVDASGGELWINILHETLKHGFSPKSWTDYLHLTIGGTLSYAGISGQAFRHGPQINNVHQLEVVTGRGDVVVCSDKQNQDLFYGVLGGLGQFGVITRARISIEPAPHMASNLCLILDHLQKFIVKWIRVLYNDFYSYTKDQEYLISLENSFEYIEGFVIINRTDLVNSWKSTFKPKDPVEAEQFISDGKTLYCMEIAKYFSPENADIMNQKAEGLLSRLNYIQHTLFMTEVPYIEFLDRVHMSELKLREKGLWDVPHPWLTLLVPKTSIQNFAQGVFGNIVTDNSNGPILIYPVNQSRWNQKTSLVTPHEDVFYLIGLLSSAIPSSSRGSGDLEQTLAQNQRILNFCQRTKLGVKQYLPHYGTQEEWRAHFGPKWKIFARRKSVYDPLAILAPGQKIFQKARNNSGQKYSAEL